MKNMSRLYKKFNTYQKCLAFQEKLRKQGKDWETYWKDAGGHVIRESEFHDKIGDADNFATIQFVDMAGSDNYPADSHIFKFVVFLYKNGNESKWTLCDTIESAIEVYRNTLPDIHTEKRKDKQKPCNKVDTCEYLIECPSTMNNPALCTAYTKAKLPDGRIWAHYPVCSDNNCPLKHPELLKGGVLHSLNQ